MAINYSLVPNSLTRNTKSYRARVKSTGIKSTQEIIELCTKAGTTVTKADLAAVLSILEEIVWKSLSEGYDVKLFGFHHKVTIRGNFNELREQFHRSKHDIMVTTTPMKLESMYDMTKVKRITERSKMPEIYFYRDMNSNEPDLILHPGSSGIISGCYLSFDKSDPEQGIFIIDEEGTEIPVPNAIISTHKEIVIMIPKSLMPGNYSIELRTRVYSKYGRKAELSGLTVN